ncbi:unnamed protein product [Nippostrongylus brasiliensis]|uniref:Tyrosine--tRNA ligase n=1 Tax=Nippostrongylus brasiliensis TaxID=27835 RepID=A0A0N4Y3R0_NIPBR|nr:unnamed protein product [Nippostrongylus brasiliensis]
MTRHGIFCWRGSSQGQGQAESLHIGNLLVVVNLLRSSQFGVRPIAVVGGATAAIGDPSGRSIEREAQSKETLERNTRAIVTQLKRIARNVLEDELTVFDNNEWFREMPMVDYLRSCKQLRVGEMLRMGAIKSRLSDGGSGISFTEFSYQTMQALDWATLLKKVDCRFQIGGSDQLGHLDLGAHYIKRTSGEFVAGVCLPLVTDSAGNKLGKSVGGEQIWLSAERTSPFHFYQFLRQLHDTEAEQMYMQYSLSPWQEVQAKIEDHRSNLGKWIAQDALAKELTRLVHGNEGLATAERCSRALFRGSSADVRALSRSELLSLFGTTIKVPRGDVGTMGDLADRTRTDKIKGSVLMTKGAFKVNGEKILDNKAPLVLDRVVLPEAGDLTASRAYSMSATRAHSKLQRLVLEIYRDFLRASRPLDPTIRQQIQREFRDAATRFQPSEVLLIEYHLRRAKRQLKDLQRGSITSVGSIQLDQKQVRLLLTSAMADHKILPVFAFVDDGEQLQQLREYLNNVGKAKLDPKGPADVSDNLIDICSQLTVMGACPHPLEVDYILNSICSLMVLVPAERALVVVKAFCEAITPAHFKVLILVNLELQAGHAVHVLSNLFRGFAAHPKIQETLYRALVAMCSEARMIGELDCSTENLQKQFKHWGTAVDGQRDILRLVHSDPLMYSALELFISGTLKDYRNFVKAHPEFVGDKLKVDEAVLLKKIRLLTLMSIAENNNVIQLDTLAEELDLPPDDLLEEFIIEAIQVNAISGKLNEMTRTLVVSSFQHRQFGREQWQTLQKRLQTLVNNLKQSHANIRSINQHIDAIA